MKNLRKCFIQFSRYPPVSRSFSKLERLEVSKESINFKRKRNNEDILEEELDRAMSQDFLQALLSSCSFAVLFIYLFRTLFSVLFLGRVAYRCTNEFVEGGAHR